MKELFNLIKEDYNVSKLDMGGVNILFDYSFMHICLFRIGSWLRTKHFLKWTLYPFVVIVYNISTKMTGIQIPFGTMIGGGLRCHHIGSIVIAEGAIIGKGCHIFQDVTVGRSFGGKNPGTPIIGDHAILFAGAKIVGAIRLGNHVIVGANAVVTRDAKDNCVIAGNPASIISEDSREHIDRQWRVYFGF